MNKVIVITGPTCVGKTQLSIALAKLLDGEIINADSTQIYIGLDIATAKVIDKENIPHHLMDIKNIDDDYTIYDYQKDARDTINKIFNKNKTPILVGGSGLYIKSALYDYDFNTKDNYNEFTNLSNDEIYNLLLEVDPNTNIHKNNRKRVVKALNYYYNNNTPYSSKEKTDKLLYDTIFIGLTTSREILYDKINKRVDDMVDNGLINEAKTIYLSNIRTKAVLTPIGYKELFPYFEHTKTKEECIEEIKRNSRRYAKKQYTWCNNQFNINWFTVDYNNFDNTITSIYNFIKG